MMQFEMKGAEAFNNEELVEFFQQLIDNGLDVKNKGKYSEIAKKLIKEGKITATPRPQSVQFIMDLFD
jgi:hypothetical protein